MRKLTFALLFIAAGIAHAETTAIVGATVHTVGPGGTIENATVVFADGRIVAIGDNITPPDGATIVDASGKVVTPGLFTPIGGLGLVEVGLSAGPVDYSQRGTRFTASYDVADAFNPRSTLIPVARIEGVTRALISPSPGSTFAGGEPGHVISGLAAVVNLGTDDNLDRRAAAMVVNLGEAGAALAGNTRVTSLLVLRSALDEARDFREHGDAFERGQHSDYNLSNEDLVAMQGVISGEIPLFVNVNRASDIEGLIALTREYGVRAIIDGGAEAWMLAEELAAADISVVLAPMANRPSNFDQINVTRQNLVILSNAGVRVAFADRRDSTHNARNIAQSAGNAVVAGMSYEDAMRAITLNPAEMYGVADRTGSIELGKEADIVIWPGDPFELTNFPEAVYIKGEAIDMVSRQTLLRDRYLDTNSTTPPAYRD